VRKSICVAKEDTLITFIKNIKMKSHIIQKIEQEGIPVYVDATERGGHYNFKTKAICVNPNKFGTLLDYIVGHEYGHHIICSYFHRSYGKLYNYYNIAVKKGITICFILTVSHWAWIIPLMILGTLQVIEEGMASYFGVRYIATNDPGRTDTSKGIIRLIWGWSTYFLSLVFYTVYMLCL
jgi:hypothetical protein